MILLYSDFLIFAIFLMNYRWFNPLKTSKNKIKKKITSRLNLFDHNWRSGVTKDIALGVTILNGWEPLRQTTNLFYMFANV